MSRAPRAQLIPTLSRVACEIGIPERLRCLAGKRAAAGIGDRDRDHDRHPAPQFFKAVLDREQRRLGIQGVEDRLDQEHVDTAVDQPANLFVVGRGQLVKGDGPERRILDIR